MDPVHDRGSMDPVQSGGPWTPGPFFVLTPWLAHLCKRFWVRAYKRRDLYPRCPITGIEKALRNKICTVEPRFNEPPYNEVLGITNYFLQPKLQ